MHEMNDFIASGSRLCDLLRLFRSSPCGSRCSDGGTRERGEEGKAYLWMRMLNIGGSALRKKWENENW